MHADERSPASRKFPAFAIATAVFLPLFLGGAATIAGPMPTATPLPEAAPEMRMNPYFSAISYNLPQDTLMLMLLPDFQIARTGRNFVTGIVMAEYGVTDRLTIGVMAEGEKIPGKSAAFGGCATTPTSASSQMTTS